MGDPAPQIPGQLTLDEVDPAVDHVDHFDPADEGDDAGHASHADRAADALAKFRERQRDRLRARGGMG